MANPDLASSSSTIPVLMANPVLSSSSSTNPVMANPVLASSSIPVMSKPYYQKCAEIVKKIVQKLGPAAPQGLETESHKLKYTISIIRSVLFEAKHIRDGRVDGDWLEKLDDVVWDAENLLDDLLTEDLRRKVMTQKKRAKKVRIFFSISNQLVFQRKMSRKIKAISEKLYAIEENGFLTERPVDMAMGDEITNREETRHSVVGAEQLRDEITNREETRHSVVDAEQIRDEITNGEETRHSVVDAEQLRDEITNGEETRHSVVGDEQLTGRNDDKKAIIKLLMDSNVEENVSVVAIVGMGGVGKTVLAKSVYNDKLVSEHFEHKIWVTVSEDFDIKQIAERIIEKATGSKPMRLQSEALQFRVRRELDGKKYLLVLDDVWTDNRENWLKLLDLLMGGAKGSKILITTRSDLVANAAGSNSPHHLGSFSLEESWALFKQIAFKEGEEPENLVKIGKEIVTKCEGLPLAIRVLGGLLSIKRTENEWSKILKKMMSEKNDNTDHIMSLLKRSYDSLPTHLKQCFALCSIYPRDHVIAKQQLIQLWIAHEFIQLSKENRCLEDVGDSYFMDLARRSFFNVVETDEKSDNLISFKLHDLIHDLAESVAGTKSSMTHLSGKDAKRRIRHVSFNSSIDSSSEDPTRVIGTYLLSYPYNENFISKFKRLRVLDMHNLGMKMVPSCISKMKYLRYLDLSENDIKKLPSSITRLQNLQTLKLSDCQDLEELPEGFGKLVSLRHLELDFCIGLTGMPYGLGQLTSLRTLPLFITGPGGRLSELKGLNNLRGKLKIELRSGKSEVGEAILKEKEHLVSLELNFRHYDNDNDDALEGLQPHPNLTKLDIRWYGGESFPTWIDIHLLLPNLVSITLLSCNGWKHLPQFRRLPSLRSLELSNLNSLSYIDENSINGGGDNASSSLPFFPSLEYLSLIELPNLKGWWNEEEPTIMETTAEQRQHQLLLLPSFPRLSRSYIRNCPMLASMPLQPCSVELKLDGVSTELVQQQLSMMMMMAAPSSYSFAPLSKLAVLYINDIEDLVSLPDEAFQSLISLRKLWICNCRRLTSLSRGMRYLTALESLRIHNCKELTFFNDDSDDDDDIPFLGFENLTSLEISQIPKLGLLPAGLQHVTSLQSLSISNCEKLVTLQNIGNLTWLQQLSISRCVNLLNLRQIGNLTSLQQLSISKCDNLTTLGKIGNLTSLRQLSISLCPSLTSLPEGMLHVTSLQSLSVSSCKNLVTLQNIDDLTSLQQLSISECANLTTLGLGNLTSLQRVSISKCENLTILWQISNLSSLLELSISLCPRLTSLPEEEMLRLIASGKLKIENCSVLCDRYPEID